MALEDRIAQWIDLGTTEYRDTWRLQEELASKRKHNQIPDTILIAQHVPIINFGQRTEHNKFSDELYATLQNLGRNATEEEAIAYLKEQGIDFFRNSRGGGSTYIGPGQLNIYPIVDLTDIPQVQGDIMRYKRLIDSIMFETLKSFGLAVQIHTDNRQIDVERKDVWITKEGKHYKLGGKGLKASDTIAYHGFNFYVTPEATKGFIHIDPCGYTNDEIGVISTSGALGKEISIEAFRTRTLEKIQEILGYTALVQNTYERILTKK